MHTKWARLYCPKCDQLFWVLRPLTHLGLDVRWCFGCVQGARC